ncbi:MAG TPA: sensor histidine kinase KdpD [Bryobacteraceae bacterium]|nr:sensor histidine kinase KdpD [Bryobacteraceae bacterium]
MPDGRLKIYLGYAAGVGKTYQMLGDAQEMRRAGRDIVIGYFEPHGRAETIARTEGLETIPRRKVEYRGCVFEEMDTEAILRRHPEVCIVDELPHTNIAGSARTRRWEDVNALLAAGIDVLTTMNIQHLESLNDQVWQISGVRVRETIPDWVMKQADEVVLVDVTPGALINRLLRGVVYSPEKSRQALENFFQEPTLVALRELAIRQTAHESESHHGDPGEPPRQATGRPERILVLVTRDPSSAAVIRRAKRVADYLHGDCIAVGIAEDGDGEAVDRHLGFARNLHIESRMIEPDGDPADTVVHFARERGVTQIFLSHSKPAGTMKLFGTPLDERIIERSPDMQVTIVGNRNRL